jgi:hypothetical protein
MKVALFSIILLHLLGDDCQSIPTFFYFALNLLGQISQLTTICKTISCTTRYESLFLRSTLSEFENFLLRERILINVTTCQNEMSSQFLIF